MSSFAKNPHFERASRAAYELPHLVKQLPAHWHTQDALSDHERLVADAAKSHACNAGEMIVRGLESIGDLLFSLGSNKATELNQRSVAGLGELLTHLAVELQYLRETEDLMADLIATPTAKSKGGSK